MNHLTSLPIYTIGIFADYSRPQSASDQTQATSDELKMRNEPNLHPSDLHHGYSCKSISNKKSFLAGLIVYLGHKRWPCTKAKGLARCSHREKPMPRTQDRLKVPKNPVILSKNLVSLSLSGDKQKLSNEPNLSKRPVLRSLPPAKKEPNFRPINNLLIYPFTHLLIDSFMSNEPNPVLPALSKVEGSEVEWISKVTHLINEQRTINYEQLSNEPNFRPNKRNFCYDKVLYQ